MKHSAFQRLALTLIIVAPLLGSPQAVAYTGSGNSEVILSFSHAVEITPDMVTDALRREQVADQVHYMFGPISDQFVASSRSQVGGILGAPRIDDETRLFRAEPPFVAKPIDPRNPNAPRGPVLQGPIIRLGGIAKSGGRNFLTYTYTGPMVLKSGPRTQIRLAMPINPKTIFQTSETLKPRSNGKNPCTDPDFQSGGDFFYFWSPDRPGCRLQAGRDFTIATATITRLPNEKSTFPEYHSLPDATGNILVTLIMGKDTPSRIRSPDKVRGRQDDLNAQNFRKIAARIEGTHEFVRRVWEPAEVQLRITKGALSPQPFVVEYTHAYPASQAGVKPRATSLTIRMVFTNCDIGIVNSIGMHRFFEAAIEQGAVTIYDGHSGLGGNLDLGAMREASNNSFQFNFPKNRYQIYFFNSCTSYAYYTDMFFDRKKVPGSRDRKGSKFLDIMATGLETAFDGSERTNMALVDAIHLWGKTGQQTSYQTLAARMEADNLFGVNGDEDNPTAPEFGGEVAPPPPPLADGEAPAYSAFEEHPGPVPPLPAFDMPEFPDSALEQGVVPGK